MVSRRTTLRLQAYYVCFVRKICDAGVLNSEEGSIFPNIYKLAMVFVLEKRLADHDRCARTTAGVVTMHMVRSYYASPPPPLLQ